jgi:uncharacterized protein YjbI with pentapeptide repeats
LQNTDFSGADLSGANLQNADLSGADLRDANMSNVNLEGANLDGILWGKNISRYATNWSNAIGLMSAQNVPASLLL